MDWQQEEAKLAGRDPPGAAQRNLYFRGKLLTAADYTAEQDYHIERRRLLNRALHGWGVIAGFAVEATEGGGLLVSPGLAFDRHGRELVASAQLPIERETDIFWLRADGRPEPETERRAEGEASYLLSGHYAEHGIDSVRIDDGSGEAFCEFNRVCETVVFSLRRRGADQPEESAGPSPEAGPDDFSLLPTAKLVRMSGVKVDIDDPVPLAMVTARFAPSAAPVFASVDSGSPPRRLLRAAATRSDEPIPTGAIAPAEGPQAPAAGGEPSGKARTGGGLRVRHVATPSTRPVLPSSDPARADQPAGQNGRTGAEAGAPAASGSDTTGAGAHSEGEGK